ncbi:hypothetical protein BKA67DRAFT_159856 [Truncatella angustata]|uniref:DUF7918 domain-containing protein n=1 Tax=Truncatella angustata TaxID=152316 RepID=A0A9P8UR50_9PEZI|nr:uncharacterized protein BKA67DRAFT_159856 [Truncatella angustata]KAH6656587.1 hypothetical protein BKA67DRAFT_159856 [Truncatella angustata]KAH8201517.1 hypothetical protein TruAng_004288 [Truncatella angustata]
MFNEDIPGVEVGVQINGANVQEYDAPDAGDEDENTPTLTKYVECIDQALFGVMLQIHGDYDWDEMPHCLSLNLHVDGHFIMGKIFRKGDLLPVIVKGREEPEPGTDNWLLHRLQFTSIKTVDDAKKDRVEKDIKLANNLGIIEVRVERGTDLGRSSYKGAQVANKKFELAEKSLKGKAVSHGTSLGAVQQTSKPNYIKFERLNEDDGPIAKFRFLYRSRDALKRELIIPRSPTPPPPAFAALTEADMRRLARERFEQLRDNNVKKESSRPIKREFGEVFDLTRDETPRGRKGKMTRLASGQRVEVINLSDDGDDDD